MSLADDLANYLLPDQAPAGTDWRWGTVTGVSPLRVRLDGETAPLAVTPDAITPGLTVGARVWCQLHGHRVIVHGPGATQTTPRDASVMVDQYPPGLSVMDAGGTTGWPDTLGTVLTAHISVHRAWQIFANKGSGMWVRSSNSSVWSPWRRLDGPWARQSGRVTIPGGSGTITSATVTFAAGRFTQPPIVQVSASTTVPGGTVQGVSSAGVTASSVTIYVLRSNATNTVVNWTAEQATHDSAEG